MSMKNFPITGWVVSVASGILSGVLLYEHILYKIEYGLGVLIAMCISSIVFGLVSLLFEVLAENLFFTRGNEFLWEYKVKAWIRDIKRKINSVFKTTYKFK